MPNLFVNTGNSPVYNAQRNLSGRTHYVDPDTLRYHKSRVVFAKASSDGLLFYLVESCALDYENTRRGFRYVIFDVFGTVIERPSLEESYRTEKRALKAMWATLDKIDNLAHTREAIERARRQFDDELRHLGAKLDAMTPAED